MVAMMITAWGRFLLMEILSLKTLKMITREDITTDVKEIKPCVNTDKRMMVSEGSKQNEKNRDTDVTVGSSITQRNDYASADMVLVCNMVGNGMSEQHQEMSTKLQVASQVWKDRSGWTGIAMCSRKFLRAKKDLPIVTKNFTHGGKLLRSVPCITRPM